ncbi:Ig-like domain-containing protein [Paenibacillus sp.]|uniref:Ig-like domain-containing protein n=1 Tax=Paenibacillus sp. TaxID=58172 RepID=UPI002D434CAC|nr:hypothetical protein [Paenibacillus sp.]HZG83824.1 hypothetical protein [Paenibacillus sp.]
MLKYVQVSESGVVHTIFDSPNKLIEVPAETDSRVLGTHYVDGAFIGYKIALTTDKPEIVADGVDTATITATVTTWDDQPATDFADPIIFEFNGETQEVAPVGGVAEITLQSEEAESLQVVTTNGGYVIQNGSVEVLADVQQR